MEKFFKQFVKEGKSVILTKEEKMQVRERLLNFMVLHPVRVGAVLRLHLIWSNIFNLVNAKPMPILLTVILVISTVTGVTLASQSSLPGETLYPVKIESENVRSVLSFSTEAKAKLEAELAQNRLEEAEELSNESKLDTDTRAQLESDFEEHANRAEKHLKKLTLVDAQAAADINSNLEVSLRSHDRILSKLAAIKDGQIEPEINKLLIRVRAETKDANKNKDDEESAIEGQAEVNIQTAAEGRLNATQNKIAEVRSFINSIKAHLSSEITAQAEARLQVAEQVVAQGKVKLDSKAYNDAFILFGQAHQIAQEAKLLVQAKKDFNLDVEFNSDTHGEIETENENNNSESGSDHARGELKVRLGL